MADTDREVVDERQVGEYCVQLLEGPTDNPIRVVSGFGHSYTFWIEGVGWKMLARALDKTSGREFLEKTVDRVVKLAHVFAEELDCTVHHAIDV